ncbi:MAG TPA: PAS domain S-box protein, partial [Dissulfurispiraceae bacterium]
LSGPAMDERDKKEDGLPRELISSEEEFRTIFELSAVGIAQFDIATNCIIRANRRFCEMIGYSSDELLGMTLSQITYPDDCQHNLEELRRVLRREQECYSFRKRYICKNGRVIWAKVNGTVVFDAEGRPLRTIGIVDDITEQRRAEEALKKSQHFIQRILDAAPNLIYIYDLLEKRNVYANREVQRFLGLSPERIYAMGPDLFFNILHPDDMESIVRYHALLAKAGDDEVLEAEYRVRHADGQWRWLRSRDVVFARTPEGEAKQILGSCEDITERKRLEAQLQQAQKMEAVGQLAGGIAHDFNNILSGIIGYVALSLWKVRDNPVLEEHITHIRELAEKAACLTRSLLAFSRKQVVDLKPLNINGVVRGFQQILSRIIGEEIELEVDLSPEDLIVEADQGQMEQVLMNLAANAVDAMPKGGTLAIGTDCMEGVFGEEHDSGDAGGRYAIISVADTGMGMGRAVQEHIFEPFFTTKEVGKGTGLGLAMAYGIIKQHNGHIVVESRPGEGTVFRIFLPVVGKEAEAPLKDERLPLPKGNGTILFIEDDASVRGVIGALLEESGYRVIEASDGESALGIFVEHKDSIELVISDVIMPKRNGIETLGEIRKVRPGVKALLTSGYAMEVVNAKGCIDKGVEFLTKPLDPEALLLKVKELLGR